MEEENKTFKVSMEGEKITIAVDLNNDGQPSIEIIAHGLEAIEEIMNKVSGIFKKKAK